MPKAGFCSDCGCHQWLQPDGSCFKGHPSTSVSGIYDAEPAGAQTTSAAPTNASPLPLLVKVALGAIFLPFTILYAIYLMWKRGRFPAPARVVLTALGALLSFTMFVMAAPSSTPPVAPPSTAVTAPAATAVPAVSPAAVSEPVTEAQSAVPATTTTVEASTPATPAPVAAPVVAPVAKPTPPPAPKPVVVPAPKPKPKPAPRPPTVATVYRTNTGSKYHCSGCRYLSRSCIPISLSDAKASGLGP